MDKKINLLKNKWVYAALLILAACVLVFSLVFSQAFAAERIEQFTSPVDPITIPAGTSLADVQNQLPAELEAVNGDGDARSVPVTWVCNQYDATEGTYVFASVLGSEFSYIGVMPTARVQVGGVAPANLPTEALTVPIHTLTPTDKIALVNEDSGDVTYYTTLRDALRIGVGSNTGTYTVVFTDATYKITGSYAPNNVNTTTGANMTDLYAVRNYGSNATRLNFTSTYRTSDGAQAGPFSVTVNSTNLPNGTAGCMWSASTDSVFDNIILAPADNMYLLSNNNALTMGENVSITNGDSRMNVGTNYDFSPVDGDARITILGGSYKLVSSGPVNATAYNKAYRGHVELTVAGSAQVVNLGTTNNRGANAYTANVLLDGSETALVKNIYGVHNTSDSGSCEINVTIRDMQNIVSIAIQKGYNDLPAQPMHITVEGNVHVQKSFVSAHDVTLAEGAKLYLGGDWEGTKAGTATNFTGELNLANKLVFNTDSALILRGSSTTKTVGGIEVNGENAKLLVYKTSGNSPKTIPLKIEKTGATFSGGGKYTGDGAYSGSGKLQLGTYNETAALNDRILQFVTTTNALSTNYTKPVWSGGSATSFGTEIDTFDTLAQDGYIVLLDMTTMANITVKGPGADDTEKFVDLKSAMNHIGEKTGSFEVIFNGDYMVTGPYDTKNTDLYAVDNYGQNATISFTSKHPDTGNIATVTINSDSSGVAFWMASTDIEFHDINLKATGTLRFSANGHTLKMGNGVTTIKTNAKDVINVHAGRSTGNFTGDSTIELLSGTFDNVYYATASEGGSYTGNVGVTIAGTAQVTNIGRASTTGQSKVHADIHLDGTDGAKVQNIYGIRYKGSNTHANNNNKYSEVNLTIKNMKEIVQIYSTPSRYSETEAPTGIYYTQPFFVTIEGDVHVQNQLSISRDLTLTEGATLTLGGADGVAAGISGDQTGILWLREETNRPDLGNLTTNDGNGGTHQMDLHQLIFEKDSKLIFNGGTMRTSSGKRVSDKTVGNIVVNGPGAELQLFKTNNETVFLTLMKDGAYIGDDRLSVGLSAVAKASADPELGDKILEFTTQENGAFDEYTTYEDGFVATPKIGSLVLGSETTGISVVDSNGKTTRFGDLGSAMRFIGDKEDDFTVTFHEPDYTLTGPYTTINTDLHAVANNGENATILFTSGIAHDENAKTKITVPETWWWISNSKEAKFDKIAFDVAKSKTLNMGTNGSRLIMGEDIYTQAGVGLVNVYAFNNQVMTGDSNVSYVELNSGNYNIVSAANAANKTVTTERTDIIVQGTAQVTELGAGSSIGKIDGEVHIFVDGGYDKETGKNKAYVEKITGTKSTDFDNSTRYITVKDMHGITNVQWASNVSNNTYTHTLFTVEGDVQVLGDLQNYGQVILAKDASLTLGGIHGVDAKFNTGALNINVPVEALPRANEPESAGSLILNEGSHLICGGTTTKIIKDNIELKGSATIDIYKGASPYQIVLNSGRPISNGNTFTINEYKDPYLSTAEGPADGDDLITYGALYFDRMDKEHYVSDIDGYTIFPFDIYNGECIVELRTKMLYAKSLTPQRGLVSMNGGTQSENAKVSVSGDTTITFNTKETTSVYYVFPSGIRVNGHLISLASQDSTNWSVTLSNGGRIYGTLSSTNDSVSSLVVSSGSNFDAAAEIVITAEWITQEQMEYREGINKWREFLNSIKADNSEYVPTDELRADELAPYQEYQKNYQEKDTKEGLIYKTAEWTNKDAGEAEINIISTPYHEIYGNPVFVYDNCDAHGLSMNILKKDLAWMTQNYSAVDILKEKETISTEEERYAWLDVTADTYDDYLQAHPSLGHGTHNTHESMYNLYNYLFDEGGNQIRYPQAIYVLTDRSNSSLDAYVKLKLIGIEHLDKFLSLLQKYDEEGRYFVFTASYDISAGVTNRRLVGEYKGGGNRYTGANEVLLQTAAMTSGYIQPEHYKGLTNLKRADLLESGSHAGTDVSNNYLKVYSTSGNKHRGSYNTAFPDALDDVDVFRQTFEIHDVVSDNFTINEVTSTYNLDASFDGQRVAAVKNEHASYDNPYFQVTIKVTLDPSLGMDLEDWLDTNNGNAKAVITDGTDNTTLEIPSPILTRRDVVPTEGFIYVTKVISNIEDYNNSEMLLNQPFILNLDRDGQRLTQLTLKHDETCKKIRYNNVGAVDTLNISEIVPMEYSTDYVVTVEITHSDGTKETGTGKAFQIRAGDTVEVTVENTFTPKPFFKARDFITNIFRKN